MEKYRIIQVGRYYKAQERFLWILWSDLSYEDENPFFYSIEDAENIIEESRTGKLNKNPIIKYL